VSNILEVGAGAINIDGCRTPVPELAPIGPEVERPSELGRYPTNLVLEHRAGCRKEGLKRIQSAGIAVNRNKDSREFQMVGWGFRNIVKDRGYADAEGMETVEDWKCDPDCPVFDLDVQSGQSSSPSEVTRGGRRGMKFGMGRQERASAPGDSGGASRFFRRIGGRR
jgi:hypothetical protein